jgi:hypothetical protein
MRRPFVAAGVKQGRKLACDVIDSANIRICELLAVEATQGEVVGDGRALVLPGADMVDLEWPVVVILG